MVASSGVHATPLATSRVRSNTGLTTLLLQEGFRPAKYFSIDRVFRNEAIDRTHLAEFHQIEGQLFFCQARLLCCGGVAELLNGMAACCRCAAGQVLQLALCAPIALVDSLQTLCAAGYPCSQLRCPSTHQHLAGVVCDYGLTLSDLIGVLQEVRRNA